MAYIASVENLDNQIRQRIGPNKLIAFVSGNFNVLHPGHMRLLKFAAENGDVLVVGINPDTTRGVSVPAAAREEGLRSVSIVDYTILLDEPASEFIAKLKPEIVVKGKEHENYDNPEQAVVDSYGGKLVFTSGDVQFASLGLLEQDYTSVNYSTIQKPIDYTQRHGFGMSDLTELCARIAGVRVLVVGDLITDTYVECDPLGMSQEDPTVVVSPIESKTFVGGAGIVAGHARKLGADVTFVSIGGGDEPLEFAKDELTRFGVTHKIFVDPTRPTTNKRRYRAHGKTMLRVNQMRQHAINHDLADMILKQIEMRLPQTDLLLFSDFNYGCLPQFLVDAATERAKDRGVMMAADSQASSQFSNIARFKGMSLLTPTEHEARLALHDSESGLVVLCERLRKMAQAQNVILTLGSEGLIVHAAHNGSYDTDRLPAFNTAPKDTAGAGDCLFVCTALAHCSSDDIWRSTYLGSLAAAHQVSRVGNVPVEIGDLGAEIDCPAD